jgi:hypothetical protein
MEDSQGYGYLSGYRGLTGFRVKGLRVRGLGFRVKGLGV